RAHRHFVELLHHADANAVGLGHLNRYRSREWILRVVTGQHRKQQPDVIGAAGHRSTDSQQSSRMTDDGKVSGGRNAAWRGLQARDSTEVRRNANRPAAVASDSSG